VTDPVEAGVYVSAGGRGSFTRCHVAGSRGYGFHVIDGCRTELTRCRTERCARGGYVFADFTEDAPPKLSDCRSDESQRPGADLRAAAPAPSPAAAGAAVVSAAPLAPARATAPASTAAAEPGGTAGGPARTDASAPGRPAQEV